MPCTEIPLAHDGHARVHTSVPFVDLDQKTQEAIQAICEAAVRFVKAKEDNDGI